MAIVDKKTPRLGLLLPNADNFLQDDVERLIQSFDLLDVLVVMRDQTTGKIADDQLSEVIARLDAQGKIATSALPSSVVQKGADGKIDASVLPSIAIIDSFPVPNEASMLGLQCERGDIAIRTDLGRSFILTDLPPSKLSNWRELTSTNVTSVNGQVGAVTGLAKAGVNDDITQLTALSGPLRLGGDAVGDYDAVTMRQLRSVSGGAGGPSMNGVMNYGVGDFHLRDSRAFIQPYEVVSDGQLLNRADWPELWAYAQMLTPISDADWLSDPSQRGKYSLGDGSTTFRVPDRNGVQADSVPGLFARGDGGNSSFDGRVRHNAAPNIKGSTNTSIITGWGSAGSLRGSGAFVPRLTTDSTGKLATAGTLVGTTYFPSLEIDASLSNSAYGRDGAAEIRPNAFEGVWVIRASGGFVAANTSWSVINGDATRPADGTTVDGGNVYSLYKVNGVSEAEARFRVRADIGGNYYARISVSNTTTGRSVALDFDETGSLVLPNNAAIKSGNLKIDFAASSNDLYIGCGRLRVSPLAGGQTMGLSSLSGTAAAVDSAWFENWGNSHSISGDKSRHTVVECKAGNTYLFYAQKLNTGSIQFRVPGEIIAATITQSSDRDLKDNIALISNATESLRKMNGYTYTLKENGMPYAGVIAQEVMEALPEAVGTQYRYKEPSSKDNPERYYTVDYSAITGLLVQVARESDERISALEKEVAELKERVNLMLQK